MSQRHHTRTGSQGRKVLPSNVKPSMKRTISNTHAVPSGSTSTRSSGPGWSKKIGSEATRQRSSNAEDIGDEMFPQFCATCEKQIVTPCSSILYCSQACRRRDSAKPTPTAPSQSPPLSPCTPSHYDHQPANIVPRMSPTVLRPLSSNFSELSLYDLNDDSDWSPNHSQFDTSFAYFGQYSAQPDPIAHRPRLARGSTATDSCTVPSLIHSPSSSYGTVVSLASTRPLPPKHSDTTRHRSIDLVTPYASHLEPESSSLKSTASTMTSYRIVEAKDEDGGSETLAEHSLKQLFRHDAMKAPPKRDSIMG